MIGVHPSTVSRELRRNRLAGEAYQAEVAQMLCEQRRRCARKHTKQSDRLKAFVQRCLLRGWSPEQMAGYLKRKSAGRISLSHELIYQMILKDQREGGELYSLLPRGHKLRNKRTSARQRRFVISNRQSIHTRPVEAEQRSEAGHMEGDTIIGKGKQSALVTLVDRASGLVIIRRVTRCASQPVLDAIVQGVTGICLRSLTLDNGSEFVLHEQITAATGAQVYFADPYSSWQRGSNENANGLIRRFFPKGTDFNTVNDESIRTLEGLLNNRPRKRLDWRTPRQAWNAMTRNSTGAIAVMS